MKQWGDHIVEELLNGPGNQDLKQTWVGLLIRAINLCRFDGYFLEAKDIWSNKIFRHKWNGNRFPQVDYYYYYFFFGEEVDYYFWLNDYAPLVIILDSSSLNIFGYLIIFLLGFASH